ncbi:MULTISPECIES: zinc ribbon domain-containing protein [unclassified Paenibacillus]|uniref:zinc ribbon domain-containing protein n=1 Tax=unclassified Paenibacillus TaxID=185978 RepID=UPI001C40B75C|nr:MULTISPECIES: zinc ribbon domain-containing protein [unclassified Paenibacillus]
MKATKDFRLKYGIPLDNATMHERFHPLRMEYEKITGMPDLHHNAIIHHRISDFGVPCSNCGKPFRTPNAKFCAECGNKVKEEGVL